MCFPLSERTAHALASVEVRRRRRSEVIATCCWAQTQLAASAPSERLIKRDAHHRVGAFPVANGILENLIFLPWQRGAPIIGCATSDGGGGPPSLEQHVSPKGSAL